MPHHNNKNLTNGFTAVEMLVVIPTVIIVIGIFIGLIVNMTGDILANRANNMLTYDVQNALNVIEQDVKSSGGYLATPNFAVIAPQGVDLAAGGFKNVSANNGTMLILNTYTTTANPISVSRDIVYKSGCPSNPRSPVMFNTVYFVINNKLIRRVLAPYGYAGCNGGEIWQKPSCSAGATTNYIDTFCKAQDTILITGIQPQDFTISYWTNLATPPVGDASDRTKSDDVRQLAMKNSPLVKISIKATSTAAGRNISFSGSIQAISPNNNTLAVSDVVTDIVTNGLIANLDAANPASYTSPSTTWNDLSGSGNNGTLLNQVGYSNGALSFDGSNDYVNAGYGASLNMTSGITLEAWIKPTTTTGWQNIVGKTTDFNGLSNGYGIRRSSETNNLQLWVASKWNFVTCNINEWCYVTLTYKSGTGGSVWKNGVKIGDIIDNGNIAPSTANLQFGQISSSAYYNGYLSVVRIYNRALNYTEIQQNFDAIRDRYEI